MVICSIMDNSIAQFITVILIFVFVLALTYFTTKWVGGYQKKQMSHGSIRIIESQKLANNKILEVVKAGDKSFLIAVCKDTVSVIGEVNEESLEKAAETPDHKESFGTVFSRFKITHNEEAEDEEK